jgi:hypothetical protein
MLKEEVSGRLNVQLALCVTTFLSIITRYAPPQHRSSRQPNEYWLRVFCRLSGVKTPHWRVSTD